MRVSSLKDFMIAAIICFGVAALFASANENVRHWFILPVCVCGVLIGGDAVAWLRGSLNLFDPAGFLGALGWYFFFLAPFLHVSLDEWMKYVQPLPDWRPWLGYMALLNVVGLLCYQFCIRFRITLFAHGLKHPPRQRIIDYHKLGILLAILLPLTFLCQILVYGKTGGIAGMIALMPTRLENFRGYGWLFMIAESFPILAAMGCICWIKHRSFTPKWIALAGFIVGFFLVQLLFGGLRGNRSVTVWKIFWLIGMIHLVVRPFSKKQLFVGAMGVLLFMYIYGFYKEAGGDLVYYLKGGVSYAEQSTKRTLGGVMLGDLGRSDVQAYVLHASVNYPGHPEPAYGQTYVNATSMLIPRQLWPDRPPDKVKFGTDALHGKGAWDSGIDALNIYGLGGEAILNFGFWGVPAAYLIFGMVVMRIRRHFYSLTCEDGRLLMMPFWVLFCVIMLTGDADNLLFFFINNGLFPMILVYGSLKNYSPGLVPAVPQ